MKKLNAIGILGFSALLLSSTALFAQDGDAVHGSGNGGGTARPGVADCIVDPDQRLNELTNACLVGRPAPEPTCIRPTSVSSGAPVASVAASPAETSAGQDVPPALQEPVATSPSKSPEVKANAAPTEAQKVSSTLSEGIGRDASGTQARKADPKVAQLASLARRCTGCHSATFTPGRDLASSSLSFGANPKHGSSGVKSAKGVVSAFESGVMDGSISLSSSELALLKEWATAAK
jgi:hypothetical protein